MKITKKQKEIFDFLNKLRLSGVCNMYQAAPFIEKHCDATKEEAQEALELWWANFNEDGYDHLEVIE